MVRRASHTPADIRNQRFGKWLVVDQVYEEMCGRKRHLAKCRCDCGTERLITPTALRLGQTTQCRTCANRQNASRKPRLTHGGTYTRLYNIWSLMRARCGNPHSQDYHRYGGRGITVCTALSDFGAFRTWALSNGYRDDLTIDRRDNNAGYSPENCRWITRKLQNRNRRDNRRVEWRGQSLILSEVAEKAGVSEVMLKERLRRGWSIERAVAQPACNVGGRHPTKEKRA